MPRPTPTSSEIERVQTAILTETFYITSLLVGLLNDEQWAATIEDSDRFQAVEYKFSDLNGQIAGYVTDNQAKRLAIRNTIRARLGLPALLDEFGTLAVYKGQGNELVSTLKWF